MTEQVNPVDARLGRKPDLRRRLELSNTPVGAAVASLTLNIEHLRVLRSDYPKEVAELEPDIRAAHIDIGVLLDDMWEDFPAVEDDE